MRLKTEYKNKIIKYANQYFGYNIKLYLFGSRVDNEKKGGDIDLFLDASENITMTQQIMFLRDIYKFVTQRKVDLIVKTPFKKDRAIFHTAKKEGVLLC